MRIQDRSALLPVKDRSALSRLITIRVGEELGSQMLNVAVGWQVYDATRDPLSLAYIGLAQFLPTIGMALIAGQAADRFDRRTIIGLSLLTHALGCAALGLWSAAAASPAWPAYLMLLVMGAARAFSFPAMSAVLPQVVGSADFPRAVAATSSASQICTIVGPALGGLIYAVSGPGLFAVAAALYTLAVVQTGGLPPGDRPADKQKSELSDESMFAGIRYIWSNRLLLGLISLDLFAVLLGGASALLPIYAKDVLDAGPIGLGCLRGAPGVGAAVIGFVLAHRTIEGDAGRLMLACVAGFGVAMLVFALSTNLWISCTALAVAGGFDMVSMVIRQTLLQLSTPDAMRGRVSAVNGVFIGASSQLGEFESGVTAALLGTVPATILGGLGTLAVVALWSILFPELRGATKITMMETEDAGVGR